MCCPVTTRSAENHSMDKVGVNVKPLLDKIMVQPKYLMLPIFLVILQVHECFQPNVQMQTFVSNLVATTHQVYSMSTIMASGAGGLTPPAIPDIIYKAHMSHLHKHAIHTDIEHATVTVEKKRVQAIQNNEWDCLEANSSNTMGG